MRGERVKKLESSWSHALDFSMFLNDTYPLLARRVWTLGLNKRNVYICVRFQRSQQVLLTWPFRYMYSLRSNTV